MYNISTKTLKNGYDSASIETDDIKIINQLIKSSNDHISGPHTANFEQEFRNYLGIKYTYAFDLCSFIVIFFHIY